MRILIAASLAFGLSTATASAQAPEMALLDDDALVTLLNVGGKRQLIESFKDMPALWQKKQFRKVGEGDNCRIKKGTLIQKIGVGSRPDHIRVRNLSPQSGRDGCPFWTEFDLNKVRYDISRRIFELKTEKLLK